jgi:hypothetical protein
MISASVHSISIVPSQQTLYAATCDLGDPPLAVPLPKPKTFAPKTKLPPAIDNVGVPWPNTSRAV